MSVISNVHQIVAFDSTKSAPYTGQRLAKIVFKQSAKMKQEGKQAKQSVCVSVPQIADAQIIDNFDALIPHIRGLLSATQDSIIKELALANKETVTDEEISVVACIAALEEETKGNRLTSESVGEWFEENLSSALSVALATKLGVSEYPSDAQMEKLQVMLANYKEKISGLAGGKTVYPAPVANKLLDALKLVTDSDDTITQKFTLRLNKMVAEWNNAAEAL